MGMWRKILYEVRKVENTKIQYEGRCTLLFKDEEVHRERGVIICHSIPEMLACNVPGGASEPS
jgi:hypothetical protein